MFFAAGLASHTAYQIMSVHRIDGDAKLKSDAAIPCQHMARQDVSRRFATTKALFAQSDSLWQDLRYSQIVEKLT